MLGIWSADDDPPLTRRLKALNFDVEAIAFTEEGRPTEDDSGTHTLWMAVRPS